MTFTIKQSVSLRLSRYEFQLRAEVDAVLPPFLGSTLRGAFGHALKAIACSMEHADCSRCFLVERCLYPRLFETSARNGKALGTQRQGGQVPEGFGARPQQTPVVSRSQQPSTLLKNRQDAPRPFIFSPPVPATDSGFLRGRDDLLRWRVAVRAGEHISFGLSLIGEAVEELPYIIYAVSLMAQHGFGSERAPFALEKVFALDAQGKQHTIYAGGDNQVREHSNCHTSLARLIEVRLAQLAIERGSTRAAAATAGAQVFRSVSSNPLTTEDLTSTRELHTTSLPHSETSPHDSQTSISYTIRDSKCLDKLTLRFFAPTRMRIKGQVIETPTFSQLAGSISLRLSMLAETYGEAPLAYDYKSMLQQAAQVKTTNSTLRLMALDRFSNRRGGKLELNGFMGDVTFRSHVIPGFLPLLVAGEFLNVGSGTAFGLGRYSITDHPILQPGAPRS